MHAAGMRSKKLKRAPLLRAGTREAIAMLARLGSRHKQKMHKRLPVIRINLSAGCTGFVCDEHQGERDQSERCETRGARFRYSIWGTGQRHVVQQ